ncbi:hypothetical protein ACFX2J_032160 [Malus domestica]
MSIALNNATVRIDITPSSGFTGNGLIFDSSENCRRVTVGEVTVCSSSSSSIGKNSNNGSESNDGGENDEVQSSYKGPLDMMNELEEVLLVRKGRRKRMPCLPNNINYNGNQCACVVRYILNQSSLIPSPTLRPRALIKPKLHSFSPCEAKQARKSSASSAPPPAQLRRNPLF